MHISGQAVQPCSGLYRDLQSYPASNQALTGAPAWASWPWLALLKHFHPKISSPTDLLPIAEASGLRPDCATCFFTLPGPPPRPLFPPGSCGSFPGASARDTHPGRRHRHTWPVSSFLHFAVCLLHVACLSSREPGSRTARRVHGCLPSALL